MSSIGDSGRSKVNKEQLLLDLLLANESIAEERDFLEAVLEVADVLVIVLDPEGRIVRFNHACEEASGYSAGEVKGKIAWQILIPDEQVAHVQAEFTKLAGGCPHTRARSEWARRDGRRRQIEWSNTVLCGLNGEVKFVIGTGLDVTRRRHAEQKLEGSEVRLAALINAALEGVLVLDENQRIELANPALCRMFGYSQSELIGQTFDILVAEPDRQDRSATGEGLDQIRSASVAATVDVRARRKDGSEFPISISVGFCDASGERCAVALVSDRTEAERQRLALERSRDEVRRLAASLLTAEMEEDRRIARELHDGLVQDLAALSVEIGLLARDRSKALKDDLAGQLRRLESTAKTMAERARDWSHELHPATIENVGLAASIESLCKGVARQSGLPVRFQATGAFPNPPIQIAISLYRITQEALRNAVSHSGTRHIDVRLDGTAEMLSIEIEDHGRGFDVPASRPSTGLGLISMEERARLIGGSVEVITHPGDGTLVRVRAPLGD